MIDPQSKFVLAHVQGAVEIRYTHGSQKRIEQALERLGYHVPNTSAIERRTGQPG